jgi:hypothetical protein
MQARRKGGEARLGARGVHGDRLRQHREVHVLAPINHRREHRDAD